MKLLLAVLSLYFTFNYGQCDHIHLVTHDDYQWFPLKTNNLQFQIKAEQFAYIRLSATPNKDQPFIKFILGADKNTVSYIVRDLDMESAVVRDGKILLGNKYNSFRILVNDVEGSVTLATALNETLMTFKDANFMKMSYFGISTTNDVKGDWIFDFDTAFPSNCD